MWKVAGKILIKAEYRQRCALRVNARRAVSSLTRLCANGLLAAALILQGPAFAQNLPDLGESSQAEFSPQVERKYGDSIMREIRRDPAYIDDPEITEYVRQVGYKLAAATPDAAGIDFDFFAVSEPTINAFALPGGYIGVHSGLLTAAMVESEFASVLAHEIAHVTQRHIARQLQSQTQIGALSIVGMVLAMLAASSSDQAAQAAMMAGTAAPVAAFLNYSREFEREADRVGFQILQAAGYDVHAMPTFFERLQRSTRLYENNAPGYLRTHPLTTERIADMQNRTLEAPMRKLRPEGRDFQVVRAKLRAGQGDARGAVNFFRDALKERRYADEAATRYGYIVALLRAGDTEAASKEMKQLRASGVQHPMFDTLAAQISLARNEPDAAVQLLQQSVQRYRHDVAVRLAYAEALQRTGKHREAIEVLQQLRSERPREPRLYAFIAQNHAALGERVEQHRALAEHYYLQGSLSGAIEQLQLAQAARDADFYTLSAVDARLRQLRAEQLQEMKDRRR